MTAPTRRTGPPDFYAAELRCSRCGSADIAHDRRRRLGGGQNRRRWQRRAGQTRYRNRCRRCGALEPFIPTLADIARACRRLRRAQGALPVSDDEERRFRRWEEKHAPPPPPIDDDAEDADDSALDSGLCGRAAQSRT
ncbi:MAG: hypothetical protein HYS13_20545 [Planctomycetia bacterium]|nr:hypothetical protein [Planctomycetia bacterium]